MSDVVDASSRVFTPPTILVAPFTAAGRDRANVRAFTFLMAFTACGNFVMLLVGSWRACGIVALGTLIGAAVWWLTWRSGRELASTAATRPAATQPRLLTAAKGLHVDRPPWLSFAVARGAQDARALADLHARLASHDSQLPRTIIENRDELQQQLLAIGVHGEGLEPESIEPGFSLTATQIALTAIVYLVWGAFLAVLGNWAGLLLYALLTLIILRSLPQARRLPLLRSSYPTVVAAPGVVQKSSLRGREAARSWRADRAVMLVSGGTRQPLRVELLGEAGALRLSFMNARDDDFIALWRRWNHPHPRPELLLGEEVPNAGADSR